MFSRSPSSPKTSITDIRSIEASRPSAEPEPRSAPPPLSPGMHTNGAGSAAGTSTRSIIGNDLTIVGQGLRIITRGTLQVDGKVEGDVVGHEVIIGERGQVTGVVSGENVIVHGIVNGMIKGVTVALEAGARVEGDVHHQSLSVQQGAHLDGRVRRPKDPAELKPDLEIASSRMLADTAG